MKYWILVCIIQLCFTQSNFIFKYKPARKELIIIASPQQQFLFNIFLNHIKILSTQDQIQYNNIQMKFIRIYRNIEFGIYQLVDKNGKNQQFQLISHENQKELNCLPTSLIKTIKNQQQFYLTYVTKNQCKYNQIDIINSNIRPLGIFPIEITKLDYIYLHKYECDIHGTDSLQLVIQSMIKKEQVHNNITIIYLKQTYKSDIIRYPIGVYKKYLIKNESRLQLNEEIFYYEMNSVIVLFDEKNVTISEYLSYFNSTDSIQTSFFYFVPIKTHVPGLQLFKQLYFDTIFNQSHQIVFNHQLYMIMYNTTVSVQNLNTYSKINILYREDCFKNQCSHYTMTQEQYMGVVKIINYEKQMNKVEQTNTTGFEIKVVGQTQFNGLFNFLMAIIRFVQYLSNEIRKLYILLKLFIVDFDDVEILKTNLIAYTIILVQSLLIWFLFYRIRENNKIIRNINTGSTQL